MLLSRDIRRFQDITRINPRRSIQGDRSNRHIMSRNNISQGRTNTSVEAHDLSEKARVSISGGTITTRNKGPTGVLARQYRTQMNGDGITGASTHPRRSIQGVRSNGNIMSRNNLSQRRTQFEVEDNTSFESHDLTTVNTDPDIFMLNSYRIDPRRSAQGGRSNRHIMSKSNLVSTRFEVVANESVKAHDTSEKARITVSDRTLATRNNDDTILRASTHIASIRSVPRQQKDDRNYKKFTPKS